MPEDELDDDDRTAHSELSSSRQVPSDAEWEVVRQMPVEREAGDGLTTAIVYAIADAEGVAASEIKEPPLYDVIDTAALESAFFGPNDGGVSDTTACATEFMYRRYRVVVQNDGWVFVYERAD